MTEHEEITFEDVCIGLNYGKADSVGVDGWAFGIGDDGEVVLGSGYTALLKIPEDDYVKIPGTKRHDQSLILLAFEIARASWTKWKAACASAGHAVPHAVPRAGSAAFLAGPITRRCPKCGSGVSA